MSTPNEPYDPSAAGHETPPSGSQPSSGSQPPAGPPPGQPSQGYQPSTPYSTPAGSSGPQGGAYPPPPPSGGSPYAPGYGGYGVAYPKNSLAVWALVLSLVGFFVCNIIGAIPALILGAQSKRAVAAGQANNGGMATAAIVIAWVTIALTVLALVALVIFGATGGWDNVHWDYQYYQDNMN